MARFKYAHNGMRCIMIFVIISHIIVVLSVINLYRVKPLAHSWSLEKSDSMLNTTTQKILIGKHVDRSHTYILPDDTTIEAMTEWQLTDMYWKYINTLQVLCRNQMRLGSLHDGGKEMCIDDLYIPKRPCLVYSFGSNNQFDFEIAVVQHFRCEVHTFDPSMPTFPRNYNIVPAGINFHDVGLSDKDMINSLGWKMQTLHSIIQSLHHNNSVIDILKIDVEGGEWKSLPEICMSGDLKYIKQLSLEIHFGNMPMYQEYKKQQLKVLRRLYEEGFEIFMHEHNLFSASNVEPFMTHVNELSLINVRWRDSGT